MCGKGIKLGKISNKLMSGLMHIKEDGNDSIKVLSDERSCSDISMPKHMLNSYKSNRDSIFKSILGLLLPFGGENFEKLSRYSTHLQFDLGITKHINRNCSGTNLN